MNKPWYSRIGRVILRGLSYVAASAVLLPVNVHAALEEIVVTATRRSAVASDISLPTTLVGSDELARVTLPTDALAAVAGVFLQQTTPGQGAAIIRGQRGSSVLHLVDGMRLNNALFRSAPTQYLALVPVSAIDRIEVIRGTPTSLYGSDAVGGAVQLVTRRPEFDSAQLTTRGRLGLTADTAELNRRISAVVDIGQRDWAASFSADVATTGDRRVGGGDRIGPSGYRARSGRAFVAFRPSERDEFSLDLHYALQPSTPRVDELVPGFGQSAAASDEFAFEPDRRVFAHARYLRREVWAGVDLTASLAMQRIDDDRRTRTAGSDERRLERNRSELGGASVTLAHAGDGGSWVAGVEVYRDDVTSSRRALSLATGVSEPTTPRFPNGAALDQIAAYINLDQQLSPEHRLTGGVRYSRVVIDLPASSVSQEADVTVSEFSGDVGYIGVLTPALSIVANVGVGFRAPNVFDLGTFGDRPGNRFNVPGTSLDSESVLSTDLGLRWQSARWRAELMAFRLDYRDRIVSRLTGDITASGRDIVQSANAARSEVTGLEFALDGALTERWRLAAGLTYTRGEQREEGAATEPGDRIPPANGFFRLEFLPTDTWQLELALASAQGQDRLSARDVRDSRIDPAGTPGWLTLGGALAFTPEDGVSFRFSIDNLTDRRYRRHGSGIDAAGRNVAIAISYRW